MSTRKKFEAITLECEGPVAEITVNRPDKLNALNLQVIQEITEALFEEISNEIRVIVLQGAGDKAFVAGADIGPMLDLTPEDALSFSRQGQHLISTLEKMPQITVAKVGGFALGGGCELAMGCDIIIASKNARFGQPEVNLGLIAGFGGTQRLVKRVGLPVALDLLLTGRGCSLSGEEAYQLGLVSRVVDADKLDSEIESVVKAILNSGPNAVAETKRLCRQAAEMTLETGLSSEATSFAACFTRDESREGISAFLEKRKPKFE